LWWCIGEFCNTMTTPLENPPMDGISRIRFSNKKGDYHVAVASWDKTVRVYDATTPSHVKSLHSDTMPVLDTTFLREETDFVSGGLSKKVLLWKVGHRSPDLLGKHDEPVSAVEFHSRTNQTFTGSWDRSVKAWDTRTHKSSAKMELTGKVFCMSTTEGKVLVGTSNKQIYIYDIRNLNHPMQTRDSTLKYQLRTLQCHPDGKSFVTGSIEGRVAWEAVEREENAKKKYAFKCHRKTVGGTENIYPVNTVAFHPEHGTFATGGGDGVVSVWDGTARKRLWRLPEFDTSVASLAFSADGNRLGIAVSYTFEEGPKDSMPSNRIFLRNIPDAEMRPKSKQVA